MNLVILILFETRAIIYSPALDNISNQMLKKNHQANIYKQNCKNWAVIVKDILSNVGLRNFWLNQGTLKPQYMFAIAKQRIFDNCKQNILCEINSSSKCRVYKHLIDHFTLQSYSTKNIPMQYKKLICKLRLSSHCLVIETGRYKNVPLEKR